MWLECEKCETTYMTSEEWEDECYCRPCYVSRYGIPKWEV